MKITKKVTKVVDQVVANQCHKCGEWYESNNSDTTQSFHIDFGPSSKYDFPWDVTVCEECLEKIVKEFLVVPDNFMGEKAYIPAFISDHELHQKLFDEWKSTGEWNYDDNPWKDYYGEGYSKQDEENEVYEEYNEDEEIVKPLKLLHNSVLKLVE